MHKMLARVGGPALVATIAVLVVGAGTVSAHIDPDPAAVEAGTAATVAFGVEHGCLESPTIALDIELPEQLTDVAPVAKPGWDATIEGRVLTFSGGPLDADTADSFSITFTAPTTPGTLLFPTVQKCTDGETAWIAVAAEGQPEPEHPAPALKVTAGPPTAEDLAPPADDEEAAAGPDTTLADTPATTDASSSQSNNDGSNTGLLIGGLVAAAAIGIGAHFFLRSRNNEV
jgi:uncharacterized protein YcnI